MDTKTLIDVVAMIDAKVFTLLIANLKETTPESLHDNRIRISELEALANHLQKAIDADVAAMESNTGE